MAQGRFKNPFEAVVTGVKDFRAKKENVRPLHDQDRLDGKTVLITGANSGVGFAIAVQAARRGADLIMACRGGHPEAGEKVKALSGSELVRMEKLDLTQKESIHALADRLKEQGVQLDVVICNAGVAQAKPRKTSDGLEEMFMVNFLAKHILLGRLLADGTIPNTVFAGNGLPDPSERPRIIFTSSDSHRNADPIDFDELGIYQDYGVNGGISRYSYYKLVLNTYSSELSRRLNPNGVVDVSVQAACPGPVNTNIAREAPPFLKLFLNTFFKLFFQSPEKAAPPFVYLAAAEEMEGKTNQYFHMMVHRRMDEKCYDATAGQQLWDKAEALAEKHSLRSY